MTRTLVSLLGWMYCSTFYVFWVLRSSPSTLCAYTRNTKQYKKKTNRSVMNRWSQEPYNIFQFPYRRNYFSVSFSTSIPQGDVYENLWTGLMQYRTEEREEEESKDSWLSTLLSPQYITYKAASYTWHVSHSHYSSVCAYAVHHYDPSPPIRTPHPPPPLPAALTKASSRQEERSYPH